MEKGSKGHCGVDGVKTGEKKQSRRRRRRRRRSDGGEEDIKMQKAFSQWSTNTESHHITGLETQRSCAAYWHKGKTHTHTHTRSGERGEICVRFLSLAFHHKLPTKKHHTTGSSLSLKWQLCAGDFPVFFSPLPPIHHVVASTSRLTNKQHTRGTILY